jgi:hypothetical protein
MLPNVTAEAMHKIAMKKNSMRFMPIVMFFSGRWKRTIPARGYLIETRQVAREISI